MSETFALYTNEDLLSITKKYSQRLEDAIGKKSYDLLWMLVVKKVIPAEEFQAALAAIQAGDDNLQIFEHIWSKEAKTLRDVWKILVGMQKDNAKLREIIEEIQRSEMGGKTDEMGEELQSDIERHQDGGMESTGDIQQHLEREKGDVSEGERRPAQPVDNDEDGSGVSSNSARSEEAIEKERSDTSGEEMGGKTDEMGEELQGDIERRPDGGMESTGDLQEHVEREEGDVGEGEGSPAQPVDNDEDGRAVSSKSARSEEEIEEELSDTPGEEMTDEMGEVLQSDLGRRQDVGMESAGDLQQHVEREEGGVGEGGRTPAEPVDNDEDGRIVTSNSARSVEETEEELSDTSGEEMVGRNDHMGEELQSDIEKRQDGGMESTGDLQQRVEREEGDVDAGERSPAQPVVNDEDGRVVTSNSARSEKEIEGELSDTSGEGMCGKTDEMYEELQCDIERHQDGGIESTGDLQQHVEREEGDVGEGDKSPAQLVDNDEDGIVVSSDSARSEEEIEEELSDTSGKIECVSDLGGKTDEMGEDLQGDIERRQDGGMESTGDLQQHVERQEGNVGEGEASHAQTVDNEENGCIISSNSTRSEDEMEEKLSDTSGEDLGGKTDEMGEDLQCDIERRQDGGMESTGDLQEHVEREEGGVGEGDGSPAQPVDNEQDGRVVRSNSAMSEEDIEEEISDTSGEDLGGKTDEMGEELQCDIERRQDGGMESTGDLQQHVEREEGDVGEGDGSPAQPVDNEQDGRVVRSNSAMSEEDIEEEISDTSGEDLGGKTDEMGEDLQCDIERRHDGGMESTGDLQQHVERQEGDVGEGEGSPAQPVDNEENGCVISSNSTRSEDEMEEKLSDTSGEDLGGKTDEMGEDLQCDIERRQDGGMESTGDLQEHVEREEGGVGEGDGSPAQPVDNEQDGRVVRSNSAMSEEDIEEEISDTSGEDLAGKADEMGEELQGVIERRQDGGMESAGDLQQHVEREEEGVGEGERSPAQRVDNEEDGRVVSSDSARSEAEIEEDLSDTSGKMECVSEMGGRNDEMGEELQSDIERPQDGGMESTGDLQQHVEREEVGVGEGERGPAQPVDNDEDGSVVRSNSSRSEEEIEEEHSDTSGEGNENATEDGRIIPILASNTDLQLFRITESCREQLEPLIVDSVETISESLLNAKCITEINHKEILSLVGQNRRTDASQLFLEAILDSEPCVSRIMWNRLVKMGDTSQSLTPLLTQVVDGDVETLHRITLQNRSAKMNFPEMPEVRLLEELFTDLTIEVTSPERSAVEHAEMQTRDESLNLGVQLHKLLGGSGMVIGKCTTIYVFYGASGIGKSTLVQKIIHDWATKNKYKHFKYVFHFKCRELTARKDRTNLNALILDSYPYYKNCFHHIWKEPRCILFIFDDLDQFKHSDDGRQKDQTREDHFSMGPESDGTVGDILRSLIRGKLIEGCSLLMTSRPLSLEILGEIKSDITFQITGFTDEQMKEYFHRYFRDAPYTTRLAQLVQQSEMLAGMSCNPLFCSLLASSLKLSQAAGDGLTPTLVLNSTRVFSDFVTSVLRGCGLDERRSQRSWLQLGEISYNGVARKVFHFEANEFGDLNVHLPNVTSACLTPVPAKDQRTTVYKFTDPVLLHFFAALTKSMSTPGNGLKGLLNAAFTVMDGRFNIFSRFLVGLSSRRTTHWLEWELGSLPPDATCSISEWLKESVNRVSNVAGKTNQGQFLNILHCLFEFGDPQMTTEALEPMRTIIFNQCYLNTFDCVVFSRTLICCGPIEELDLNLCGVKSEGIRYLEHVLYKCKVLRLKSNQLTDDCFENLFSVVQTNHSLMLLDLSNCDQDTQKMNEFTAEKLQTFVESCGLQRETRWAHHEDTEHNYSMLDKASNILTIITE